MGVMIKHIPPLSQHAEVLKDAYTSRWAIHQIQPMRSQIHLLCTTSIDELKTVGNQDVLYNSFLTQIQLCKNKGSIHTIPCDGGLAFDPASSLPCHYNS